VYSAQVTLPTPTPADAQAHAWIGCRGGTEPPYDGLVDDIRIYSRALTPAEITALAK
jgi:hypothetical protein